MKTKLIKLSDSHYVVVSDEEIKEGDWFIPISGIGWNLKEPRYADKSGGFDNLHCKKITHSTRPESLGVGWMKSILPLLLSEVEELLYGYSAEKMSAASYPVDSFGFPTDMHGYRLAFNRGFKTHRELVKDKMFTVDDVSKIFAVGVQLGINQELFTQQGKPLQDEDVVLQRTLQSLLPKTEWDIEFVDGKIKLI